MKDSTRGICSISTGNNIVIIKSTAAFSGSIGSVAAEQLIYFIVRQVKYSSLSFLNILSPLRSFVSNSICISTIIVTLFCRRRWIDGKAMNVPLATVDRSHVALRSVRFILRDRWLNKKWLYCHVWSCTFIEQKFPSASRRFNANACRVFHLYRKQRVFVCSQLTSWLLTP